MPRAALQVKIAQTMSGRDTLSHEDATLVDDLEGPTQVERSGVDEDADTVVSEVAVSGSEADDEDTSTITAVDEKEPSDVVDLDTLLGGWEKKSR